MELKLRIFGALVILTACVLADYRNEELRGRRLDIESARNDLRESAELMRDDRRLKSQIRVRESRQLLVGEQDQQRDGLDSRRRLEQVERDNEMRNRIDDDSERRVRDERRSDARREVRDVERRERRDEEARDTLSRRDSERREDERRERSVERRDLDSERRERADERRFKRRELNSERRERANERREQERDIGRRERDNNRRDFDSERRERSTERNSERRVDNLERNVERRTEQLDREIASRRIQSRTQPDESRARDNNNVDRRLARTEQRDTRNRVEIMTRYIPADAELKVQNSSLVTDAVAFIRDNQMTVVMTFLCIVALKMQQNKAEELMKPDKEGANQWNLKNLLTVF